MLNPSSESASPDKPDQPVSRSPSDFKVFISWAHRDPDWDEVRAELWTELVREFAELLVHSGIAQTDIDLWHLDEAEPDWTRWGPQQIKASDYVIVPLSVAWKQAWEGTGDPSAGAGAAGEANELRGLFQRNRLLFQKKVLLVVLPELDDPPRKEEVLLPDDLRGVQRRYVTEVTKSGLTEVLRLITAQPRYVKPIPGEMLDLPPALPASIALPMVVGSVPVSAPAAVPDSIPRALLPTASHIEVSGNGSTVLIGENHVHHASPPLTPLTPYRTIGRQEFLAGALVASNARRRRLRYGAGLNEQQVNRSLRQPIQVPAEIREFPAGETRVLAGPLGSGKSEVAEEWLQASIIRAQSDDNTPVSLFVTSKELEESIDIRATREVGLETLYTCGVDIVVDGLDERTDLAATKVHEASEFVARWPRSRVLLTTRNTDTRDKSVQVDMKEMSEAAAESLMNAVAGRRIGSLGPQLKETVNRPFFALLAAAHATADEGVTGIPELIDRVVEHTVESEGNDLVPHLMELALETVSTGKPVDPAKFAPFEIAAKIRKSPLVTVTGKACAFSLATFEQWFAAQAVLDGKVDVAPLLTSMRSFDRWKYVFAILLSAGEPTKVDEVMSQIVRWNPGAAAWVIKETKSGGLTRHLSQLQESDWESAGHRIRSAQAAWLDGLGPLGNAFFASWTGYASRLDDVAMSVSINKGRIRVRWIAPRQLETSCLPEILKSGIDYGERSMKMKGHASPVDTNWVWALTQSHLQADISKSFAHLVMDTAQSGPGIVHTELQAMVAEKTRNWGSEATTPNLYPSPDIAPTNAHPWGNFTEPRMYERSVQIATAALECYSELVDRMVPNFTGTLGTHGLFPVEFYGDISFTTDEDRGSFGFGGPPESWLKWTLRARARSPFDEATTLSNTVNLTLNDEARSADIDDDRDVHYDRFQVYLAESPEFEAFAPLFIATSQRFSPTEAMPATTIAMELLWKDLEKLNWVEGHIPRF